MNFRLMLAAVLCAFVITSAAQGQAKSDWTGTYEHTANLGRTVGGTGIVISYVITISPDNSATIQASGYQTDDEIRCDARARGNKISLYFKSYPDGGVKNQFGVQLYKKGDFLLSLERINSKRFRARWGKYNTDLTKSVIFIKARGSGTSRAPQGSVEKIGITECDDYLAKYEACILTKLPEASRAQLISSIAQTRVSWRQAAATPQGKASLSQACKTALDQTRQALNTYGCDF